MFIAKPSSLEEGKDQTNAHPLELDPVSLLLGSLGGANSPDDSSTPLSVAQSSGGNNKLSDYIKNRRFFSPIQSPLKGNYCSRPTWQDSGEKSQVWDLERYRIDDQDSLNSTYVLGPSRIENLAPRVGAGLTNLGNTCFMNAILQCFTHTVPFIQGLFSSSHVFPCDCYNNDFCVICALHAQIKRSLTASGETVSPMELAENLSYFSSSFTRHEQEDAHEFMQSALDKLDRRILNLKENDKTFEDDNLVEKIFGGRLISKLRCSNCGHSSNTYEPLIDMSLEIENVDTLQGALESFTKVEHIEGPFKCDGCKEQVSLEKQLLLDQAPSVAAFHLKRFKTDGTYVEKLDKQVEFPLELDLQLYSDFNQNIIEPMKYDLYAVVVHTGVSATSGHYFCYVRSAPNIWHRLDDSEVIMVTTSYVLSEEAYILFYAQHGTPWFSSIMKPRIQCLDPPIVLDTSPKSVLDRVELPKVNDTSVASQGCEQFPANANQENFGQHLSASADEDSHAESGGSDKNRCSEVVFDFGKNNDGFNHLTPPSLSGPVRSCHFPRNQLKQKSGSIKRPKNKLVGYTENSTTEISIMTYASKLRRSRRDLIYMLVARNGKKRKEVDSSPCKEDNHQNSPKKSNHASVMHPMVAGSSQ